MAEVLMPEKRGGMAGLMNMFSQGTSMLQAGAKGKEAFGSLMGGSGGGGGAGGLGAGAGAYSLGVGNVTPVTQGMSPTLGGGSTAAAGGESAASFAGPAVALGMAGYGEYKAMKNPSLRDKMVGNRDVSFTGQKLAERAKMPSMPSIGGSLGKGLSLTDSGSGGDKMSALERRYQNTQNASAAIEEAHSALKDVQLPDAERRSIYQKLELARQGGQKRGSSVYS
jgi:hypothetical protein